MKNIVTLILGLSLFLVSCQKEKITFSTEAHETFFLQEKGNSMPIHVHGNTASKTFLLMVHGGPGGDALIYRDSLVKSTIETDFAVVYWDQRSAGSSQGNYSLKEVMLEDVVIDLERVISILQSRYGKNISLFLNGHSWGGYLTPAYLVKGDNQKNIKGWIHSDGAHDIPLLNILSKELLLQKSTIEISSNRNVAKWTEIKDYVNSISLPATLAQTNQMNTYANDAIALTPEVKELFNTKLLINNYINNDGAITALLIPKAYNEKLAEKLTQGTDLQSKLDLIQLPTLSLFGEWDYKCPPKLGDDVLSRISSAYKKNIIYSNSGHSPMFSIDKYKYWADVKEFMNKFK
jgi:pimeloyl-ACP methyl ester carboxylesterase